VGEVLRILVLRRWVFFIPFCLATTAAFIASQYVPRAYEAETVFEQANDPVSVDLPPELKITTFDYFLATLREDVRSNEVMGPVVDELGLTKNLPRKPDGTLTAEGLAAREKIGRSLASRVWVHCRRKTGFRYVIRLRYTGADPEVMNRLLNLMKEGYIRLVRRRVTEKLIDAQQWYAARAQEKRAVLDEIDKKLITLKIAHPGVDPTNAEAIAFQLASLRSQLAELQRTRARLGSEMASRKEFLAKARGQSSAETKDDHHRFPVLSAEAARLEAAIAACETRITDLKTIRGMTNLHPEIIDERKLQERYRRELQAELESSAVSQPGDPAIAAVKSFVAGPVQGVWLPAYAKVEMELASLVEQQEQVAEESERVESRVGEFVRLQGKVADCRQETGRIQEEYERAWREYETYQGLVDKCNQSLAVASEDRGIIFTNVTPPEGSAVPISPLAKTVLLLSLLAGLATGTVFVVIAELFDRRFRTSSQVAQALGVPILENIDEIVTAADRRGRFLRRAVFSPAIACLLLGIMGISGGLSYLSLHNPTTFERIMSLPKSAWASIAESTDESRARSADHEGI